MSDGAARRFYSQHEKNESFQDFSRRFNDVNKQRSQMLMLGSLKENDAKKVIIYFSDEPKKTGVKPVKELSEKMEEKGIQNAILVAQNVPTAFARNAIAEVAPQRIIEYFVENELLVNITKHELVPKHVPLTDQEKQALLKQYKIKDIQLPRIQQNDAVARYFGLHRGQVVKIIRPSESAGRYVTYRLCV